MTIQNYLTVNWDVSPRIITVVSGVTEITIQDLHDTCRYLESQPTAMDDDRLIDSAGKEFLGGATYVGLTATLNNAVLAFAARGGPQWVLCKITGGNIVSIDENGNNIDPRYPTAYVTVDRASSSSATFLEELSVQHSSFGGGVTIDTTSSYAGTDYPIGTSRAPVNNLTNAKIIAVSRGFDEFDIIGNITLEATGNVDGYCLHGQGVDRTTITVTSGCSTNETRFKECTLTGVLSGGSVSVVDAFIGDLDKVSGFLKDCVLQGKLTLTGSQKCRLVACVDGYPGLGEPEIDMGGAGRALGIRGYYGGLRISNKSGTEDVSINLTSGRLEIASDVTAGTIVVRGVGEISSNEGTAEVYDAGLVNPLTITETLLETGIAPYTTSGTVGEAVSDTVTNARLIPGTL